MPTHVGKCPVCKAGSSVIKGELIACSSCSARWWSSDAIHRVGDAKEYAYQYSQDAGLIPKSYIEPHHWVYVIALKPEPTKELYVGQTGLSPEHRFLNHKRGYKAGKMAKKHGLAIVKVEGPMTGDESRLREKALISELREKGFEVYGK